MPARPEPPAQVEGPLALAAEFPTPTREQWRKLVAAVLAKPGTADQPDPELSLASTTYDGILVKPLYTSEDAHGVAADGLPGHPPFVRGATAHGAAATGWDVRQRHADTDAARTNAAVLADLANGATSLWLVVGQGGIAVSDLPVALDGVYLDLAPIVLDAGVDTASAAAALLGAVDARAVNRGDVSGSLGADPIGVRAGTGADADPSMLVDLAALAEDVPQLRIATVDGTVYHNAGGSDADELGIAAAVGVAYLRAMTQRGLSVDAVLNRLDFRYAISADQFVSIAKLRAARRIWDRIAELSGAAPDRRGQRQHAVTSAAMMTRRDPWVNMLRTTIACFSAAVGGAEAITVLPFDAAIGLSDDFARRIARNTSAVLHDESSLARVIDAAGGSWYVESLTDGLAEKAWQTFIAVERAGGALAALDDGTIPSLLRATRQARAEDIAHRRLPITGVSEFAFLDEAPVVRPTSAPTPNNGPLPRIRYAQDFEALREVADRPHQRPRVFLAALGPVAAHSARVGFATNLFRAGGIECVVGTGEVEELAQALRDTRSAVACLCSSDTVYAADAVSVVSALREAGASLIWVAGKPNQIAGVDGYLHTGVDALAVLRTTLGALDVGAS